MTDIYGTLGPSCASADTLTEMFRAGMTGIRINLSHEGLRAGGDRIAMIHQASRRAGIRPKILMDMQGPELRIGVLAEPVNMTEGGRVVFAEEGAGQIPVPAIVLEALTPGREVLMDDGRILAVILSGDGSRAEAEVLRGGLLQSRKSIAVHGAVIHPPTMTEADLRNIRDAAEFGITGIMQPFVRSRQDLIEVRQALRENGAAHLELIAKIENRQGLGRLPELLKEADSVCIARGDLGNDMDLWKLPAAQKEIGRQCRQAGVPFIVATQMLFTMTSSAVPTRAEVSDIFNTVADGASGVMVTGETAVGSYPVEVIRYLANTAAAGEAFRAGGFDAMGLL